MNRGVVRFVIALTLVSSRGTPLIAQAGDQQSAAPEAAQAQGQQPDHQHMNMPMNMEGWQFMQETACSSVCSIIREVRAGETSSRRRIGGWEC